MAAINFMIGTCAIPLKSILALIRAKYWLIELLSGLLIPMTFFPHRVQRVLAWLPFEHIAYTPLQIYLGKLDRARDVASDRNPMVVGDCAAVAGACVVGTGVTQNHHSRRVADVSQCSRYRSRALCKTCQQQRQFRKSQASRHRRRGATPLPAVLRLFLPVCESARQLSRRFLHQPGHQLRCDDLFAAASSSSCFRKSRNSRAGASRKCCSYTASR